MYKYIIFRYFLNINTVLVTAIGTVAVLGDICVSKSNLILVRAFCDNFTHLVIGGLSWIIVLRFVKYSDLWTCSLDAVLCTFLASAIDADHFLEAQSLNISKATALSRRPIFHCTTIPVVLAIVLLFIGSITESPVINRLAWIQLTAFLSHHTRDATRRGYWLYPFGSTPPVPYPLYILLSMSLPFGIAYAMNSQSPKQSVDLMRQSVLEV